MPLCCHHDNNCVPHCAPRLRGPPVSQCLGRNTCISLEMPTLLQLSQKFAYKKTQENASRAVEGVRVWAEPIGRNPHATWFLCVFYLVFSRHRLASSPPSRFEPTALIAWLAAAFCPPCISTPLPLCLALDRPLLRRAGSLQRAQGPHGSLACNPHQCLMSLARVSSVPTGQTGWS